MLGEADLRADLRLPRGAAGDPGLLLARQTCVLASRAAGLPSPVGSAVHRRPRPRRAAGDQRDAWRRWASVGRSCIHPQQAAVVHEAFAPRRRPTCAWARSVLAEAGAQDGADGAASVLADGSFVDPADRARRPSGSSPGADAGPMSASPLTSRGIGRGPARRRRRRASSSTSRSRCIPGMPVSPSHPGFQHSLQRRHGDVVRVDGTSGANDILVLGTHIATHVDALAHISHDGLLHGGVDARGRPGGRPVRRARRAHASRRSSARGVLLDLPAHLGVDAARRRARRSPPTTSPRPPAGRAIEPGCRDHGAHRLGPAVGRPVRLPQPRRRRTGARRGCLPVARRAGAATGRRRTPPPSSTSPPGEGHARLPGHRVLLVESGIPIMEMLHLERLAALAPRRVHRRRRPAADRRRHRLAAAPARARPRVTAPTPHPHHTTRSPVP